MIIKNVLHRFGSTSGRFAAWIILAFSIVLFTSLTVVGFIVGFIMIGITVFMITAYDGIEVNVEGRIYRKTTNCYGLSFGSWQSLPDIRKVSVLETTDSIYASSNNSAMSGVKKVFVLRLHQVEKKETIAIGRYNSHQKATAAGEYLSQKLNVEFAEMKR